MEKLIVSGEPEQLSERGGDACTLAIARDSSVRWFFELVAHLHDGGARVLGRINTCPAGVSGASQSRVIASASLPGVDHWTVQGRCLAPGHHSIVLELVTATGLAQPSFRDFEFRSTRVISGVDGAVALPQGQRLVSVAAMADGADGQIVINGGAPIIVPDGRAVRFTLERIYGASLNFVDTANYLVEVEG